MENLKHLFIKFKKQVVGIERIKNGQYQLKRNFGFENDRGIWELWHSSPYKSMVLWVSII